ncbi:DUF4388 domain-containing protein [Deinococcus rubellus]|uniref:response regulator n=1 Tax=Deinococcus rubellus TaxID=1889240 RepID=UPI0031F10217
MRALLVMTDDVRREAVAVLAANEGLDITSTDSGLHALTQLERSPPDVIICDDRLGDLSGAEFHEIVRSEPGTRSTPLLLLSDTPHHWLDPHLDLSVPYTSTSRELVAALMKLIRRSTQTQGQLGGFGDAPDPAQISGTLEIMNLFDVITTFNQMRKTGRILVNVAGAEALIYLLSGEIRHTEYGIASGHPALLQAFVDTYELPTSFFVFTVAPDPLVECLPETITLQTSRLLLETAFQLDRIHSEDILFTDELGWQT